MAGEVDAMRRPAGSLGRVEPEDPERHRQAAPAFQDADQVGVGEVVIGLGIAGQPECAVDDAGEHFPPPGGIAGIGVSIGGGGLHRGAGDGG